MKSTGGRQLWCWLFVLLSHLWAAAALSQTIVVTESGSSVEGYCTWPGTCYSGQIYYGWVGNDQDYSFNLVQYLQFSLPASSPANAVLVIKPIGGTDSNICVSKVTGPVQTTESYFTPSCPYPTYHVGNLTTTKYVSVSPGDLLLKVSHQNGITLNHYFYVDVTLYLYDSLDDPDGDAIPTLIDNCPNNYNSDQGDVDSDGMGNVCDLDYDSDGDGVGNELDSFPYDPARSAANTNILYTFNGDYAGDLFGRSVSGAGDVNNDGYTDMVIGGTGNGGSAKVLSGVDGAILYIFNGDSAGDQFGYSVSGAGDVNNDGYADVIAGAYLDDNNSSNSGSARLFSGVDGNILYTFDGDGTGDAFGYSVSGAGDVNNDGYADVIAGAYLDDNNGDSSGSARVFSGSTGSILYTFNGDDAGDLFGESVSGAGDVNNDGYADLIVGARADDNNGNSSGSARVFSGVDGNILYTFNGDSNGDYFGNSVSEAGDINNDGYDDVIVGAHWDDNSGSASGMARVFSGIDGSILYTFNGDRASDYFGYSVSGAGDVNSDGYDDVIVGAYQDDNSGGTVDENSGSARLLSGVDGSILYVFNGDSPADDYFGYSVSGAGDVNNDGYTDVIVGAFRNDHYGINSGLARVFSGKGLWVDSDNDGENDAIDNDDDNDGILDINDLYPLDTDNDGLWNGLDWDDDNDGVPDVVDAEPLNSANANEVDLPLNAIYKGSRLRISN